MAGTLIVYHYKYYIKRERNIKKERKNIQSKYESPNDKK